MKQTLSAKWDKVVSHSKRRRSLIAHWMSCDGTFLRGEGKKRKDVRRAKKEGDLDFKMKPTFWDIDCKVEIMPNLVSKKVRVRLTIWVFWVFEYFEDYFEDYIDKDE